MQPQFFNIINDELRGSEKSHAVTNPRTEEDLSPPTKISKMLLPLRRRHSLPGAEAP